MRGGCTTTVNRVRGQQTHIHSKLGGARCIKVRDVASESCDDFRLASPSRERCRDAMTTTVRGNLKQRAELTLRAQAYVFDEVVVVDFNSAALTNRSTAVVKSPLIDTLELEVATRAKIVSVIINASACAVLMGRPCGQQFYETAARNVGVRAATGDFVVSTNIDDLPPHRELLQGLIARMGPNDALLLPRLEISLEHGAALFRREGGGGVDEALRMLQVRPADYHAAARSGCGSGGTSAWGFERPGWRTCMSLTHLRGLFTERTNRSRAFQAVLHRKKSPAHFLGSQMVLVGCPGWRRGCCGRAPVSTPD